MGGKGFCDSEVCAKAHHGGNTSMSNFKHHYVTNNKGISFMFLPFENAIMINVGEQMRVEKNVYKLKFGISNLQDIEDWRQLKLDRRMINKYMVAFEEGRF